MAEPINMAVLLSGSGRTLQNFIDLSDAGKLDAKVSVVISSRADAYGLERAKVRGIPAVTVASAGFMCLFRIPERFLGRAMNIHPALIPCFCGKGYYGHRVHEAVLEHGCKVSGCTVHFADNEYDNGPIIIQKTVPVLDDDTPDTLAARVFEKECEAYPEAVQLFAEGRLKIEGRRVRILPGG